MSFSGNPAPMEFPSPPTAANIDELHRWALSVTNWVKNTTLNGLQSPVFGTQQLTDMQSQGTKSQAGKLFYDVNTDELKAAVLVGGNLTIKTVTLA